MQYSYPYPSLATIHKNFKTNDAERSRGVWIKQQHKKKIEIGKKRAAFVRNLCMRKKIFGRRNGPLFVGVLLFGLAWFGLAVFLRCDMIKIGKGPSLERQ